MKHKFMTPKKPTLTEIRSCPDSNVKLIVAFINSVVAKQTDMDRESILHAMESCFGEKEEVMRYGIAYLDYMLENDEDDQEERTQEDILEFGDLDDDDDDEYDGVCDIDSLIDGEEEEIEVIVWPGGYRFYCDVNDSRAEFPVEGVIRRITPAAGQFLHIDIELPSLKEKGDLHVCVRRQGQDKTVDAWFDKTDIPLF